jgi:hypothetical protein
MRSHRERIPGRHAYHEHLSPYRFARTWAQHPRAQGDPSSSVLRDCLEPLRRRAHDLQDGVAVHRRRERDSRLGLKSVALVLETTQACRDRGRRCRRSMTGTSTSTARCGAPSGRWRVVWAMRIPARSRCSPAISASIAGEDLLRGQPPRNEPADLAALARRLGVNSGRVGAARRGACGTPRIPPGHTLTACRVKSTTGRSCWPASFGRLG